MGKVESKIALLLLIFCALTMNVLVLAEHTVGVQSGQWIKYDINVSYAGETQSGWIKITIQSVSGTTVSGTMETVFPASSTTDPFTVDVSGGGNITYLFIIIPANSQPGQTFLGLTITGQIEGNYAGVARKVLYATLDTQNVTATYYWDQTTGMPVEANGSGIVDSWTFHYRATETNMWAPGGFDWILWVVVIAIVACVVVAAIFIFILRRRRRKPPVAPPLPHLPPPVLRVSADPKEIIADGKSTSRITIELVDVKGAPLPAIGDTEISLYTTGGAIASSVMIPKNDYSASTTLTSSQNIGTVVITARSEGSRDTTVEVVFSGKNRYCMHCGSIMAFTAKSCSKCGKAPPAGLDTKVCKNCKAVIPVVAKFCGECGAGQPE